MGSTRTLAEPIRNGRCGREKITSPPLCYAWRKHSLILPSGYACLVPKGGRERLHWSNICLTEVQLSHFSEPVMDRGRPRSAASRIGCRANPDVCKSFRSQSI